MPDIIASRTSVVDSNADKGILVLPLELISETLKNYKKIEIHSTSDDSTPFVLPRGFSVRPGVLRALSQVCQVYREVFLPLAYESLATCLYPKSGHNIKSHHKTHRQITVSLTTYKGETAIPLFVACLAALPNLRSIKIVHAPASLMKPFRDTFKQTLAISFPTVHTVAVRPPCHGLMFALPEVRSVWVDWHLDATQVATSLINAGCKKVEVLKNFDLSYSMLTRLLNKTPMLRHVTLTIYDEMKYFEILKRCKRLDTIELRMEQVYFEKKYREPTMDLPPVANTIKTCRAVLKASPSSESKFLRLVEVGPSPRAPELEEGEMSYTDIGLD
ncbi:hypothetical protein FA13DRAFT_1727335 [Coprinellus micaceus]|uniref:F-box domain-containing protein n=1 Tax=Coprinellus micaceus TaxID=71717 RepID=A0A4Y7TSY6_COPMI|nr:hypothetical protein FA13DRAFT_1727335 [Coprinellus micaceus]